MKEQSIKLSKQSEQEAELQERFSKMAKKAEDMPRIPETSTMLIEKADWIGLRLLSLMLSTDVSAINMKDVARSLNYYRDKYTTGAVSTAFAQLTQERAASGEWRNPESKALWELETMLKHVGEDLGWKDDLADRSILFIRRK